MRKCFTSIVIMGVLSVSLTGYRPVRGEGGPIAADGACVVIGRTCAISRDLRHLLGQWINIEGVGLRLAHDLTAARLRRTVDVAVEHKSEASALTRKNVSIKVVD